MAMFGELRAVTKDGQVRIHPLDKQTVSVGRSPQNDIVLDETDATVARHEHARLRVENGLLLIQQVAPGHETFAAELRLTAGDSRAVAPGEIIRIGSTQLTFQPTGVSAPPAPSGRGDAPVTARLTISPAPIVPGSSTVATLEIRNRGAIVDEFGIAVTGPSAAWTRVTRPSVRLLPGTQEEVSIEIRPPRAASATAGSHDFAVAVRSAHTGHEMSVLGRFEIAPFSSVQVQLDPVRAKEAFSLGVRNNGNEPLELRDFAGTDDEAALVYDFDADTLRVAPTEEAAVGFTVKARRRKVAGQPATIPFTVTATAAPAMSSVPQAVAARGELIHRPPLRSLRWFVMAPVAVALLGGAALAVATGGLPSWAGGDSAAGSGDDTPRADTPVGGGGAEATEAAAAAMTATAQAAATGLEATAAAQTVAAGTAATATAQAAAAAASTSAAATATAAAVFETGSLELSPRQGADLETGRVHPLNTSATPTGRLDLTLQQAVHGWILWSGPTSPLTGLAEARFATETASASGKDGCIRTLARMAGSLKAAYNPFDIEGRFLCMRTSDGRTAEIHIQGLTDSAVTIGFTVWE